MNIIKKEKPMKHTVKLSLLTLTLLTTQSYASLFYHNDNKNVQYNSHNSDYNNDTIHYNTHDYGSVAQIDSRQGWMASLGLGMHTTGIGNDYDDTTNTESGLATSLKIGYNFTEQFSVQYVRNASWYTPNDDLFASGIMGIGATFYFQPQAETWYISATAGVADLTNIDASASDTGGAFMLTIGYEFSPHWQIEGSLLGSSIDNDYNDNTIDTSSVQFLLNYSWY